MWKLAASLALVLVSAESVEVSNGAGARRLTITNGCNGQPLWIAHIVANAVGPDQQDVKINPGESYSFQTADSSGKGLPATRFWPKMGCDSQGSNCSIGDSGGPGEGCVVRAPGKPDNYDNCAPPTDTKIEATFSTPGSPTLDTLDMSLVDGYSLPFKLQTLTGTCTRNGDKFISMDCSRLSLDDCPSAETLHGTKMSLKATNPKTGKVSGCYSPCMRLTDNKWQKSPVAPDSAEAGPYCCAGAFNQPQTCKAGPVLQTQYLKDVKATCSDAYGYAYDDKVATIACTTSTAYSLTFFCPIVSDGEVIV